MFHVPANHVCYHGNYYDVIHVDSIQDLYVHVRIDVCAVCEGKTNHVFRQDKGLSQVIASLANRQTTLGIVSPTFFGTAYGS